MAGEAQAKRSISTSPGSGGGAAVPPPNPAAANLLLDAFQVFTEASNSLESAFYQLEARTRRISEELAVTNRELKKSLREREIIRNYLRRILECLPCGVLVFDSGGHLMMCNPVAARLLDQPRGKVFDGSRGGFPLSQSMRDYLAAFACQNREGAEMEIPLVARCGMKILAASCAQVRGRGGRVLGMLHIIRDVTQIKALEEQNKRGERLSAMGEMAVELAHEIRNPLGSIELFASLLEQELPRESDPGRWAENIRIGSRSLNTIVSNMLQFSNPHAPEFTAVDLHELVAEIMRFTDPVLRQREVAVQLRLEAADPIVAGDRELLRQVLLNLVFNALQAIPSRGALVVSTLTASRLPGGAFCDGVELRVRDTGLGIPPENLERIFDPFFTTNKNGTGLGLSVVHQIVDQHSGFIEVESEVNRGTTFRIYLPGVRLPSGGVREEDGCEKRY